MSRPRVLLADDHAPLREALERFLREECDVVATAADGPAMIVAAQQHKPDVIVMDLTIPLVNVIDATTQLKRELPDTHIVFLTMNDESDLAAEMFRIGASGYVLKRSARSELLPAIHEVMRGGFYVTPAIASEVAGGREPPAPTMADRQLTPRQREIVRLVAQGHSAREVASMLNISPRAVASQKAQIMQQLHLDTMAGWVRYAVAQRLI